MKYLDIQKVPFTYPGAYYTIQWLGGGEEPEGLYIRSLHQDAWQQRAIQILAEEEKGPGRPLAASLDVIKEIRALPHELCIVTETGKAFFCFAGTQAIAFRTEGVGLTLRYVKASQMTERDGGIREVNCFGQNMKVSLLMREGSVRSLSDWDGDNCTQASHVCSENAEGILSFVRDRGSGISGREGERMPSYEACARKVRKEFEDWMEKSAKPDKKYEEAYALASYLNWSSLAEPCGQIPCPTMYASKVSMLGIWSWDHCFHALGIWDIDKKLAFEQWRLMFLKQAEDGALPDRIDDALCCWSFSKPPVHGFFLTWMRRRGLVMTQEETRFCYTHVKRWTDYWFCYHDSDRDGVPEYDNGNDSGWDNNTVMVKGGPVESPDLSMWLILQMECLKELAEELALLEEAKSWEERSGKLTALLCEHFWDEEKGCMTGRLSGSHETVTSDSLLLYLPLLLGDRLPEHIRRRMAEDLKREGEFLTEHGLATERLDSRWYSSDGYWRGPIWAPSTYLICEGLKRCGEEEFAQDIRERFLNVCADSMAMPENFDAVTGEPLRDSALVWTASVFVRMAADETMLVP